MTGLHSMSTNPQVLSAVRLLHRRRGWIWTTVISAVAWLVTLGLLGSLAPNAKGAGEDVAAVFVLLLTIVFVVALVASIVDTVRLHRLDPGARAHAKQHTSHHPVRAHAYRYPPRHRFSWVFGWLMMLIVFGLGVATLPGLVDGIAYLEGVEHSASFLPTSYGQSCSRSGCHTVTNGFFQVPGEPAATWPDQVPLDQPFPVAQPLWNWGFGSELIDGDLAAIGHILAGMLFDGGSVLIVFFGFMLGRNWVRHRRGSTSGLVTLRAFHVPSRRSAGAPGL